MNCCNSEKQYRKEEIKKNVDNFQNIFNIIQKLNFKFFINIKICLKN